MSHLLNCIVAVCPDMGIGRVGNLPWHPIRLSNEFKHFQKMTMTPTVEGKKNVVVMGRKTWFSIPKQNRPLKNRINVVLSRKLETAPEGAHYLAPDFNSALRLLENPELQAQADQVWIIGGSLLYKVAMESSARRRLFVTRILKQFDCDTFIPNIDLDKFRLLPESEIMLLSRKRKKEAVSSVERTCCAHLTGQMCFVFDSETVMFPGVPVGLQEECGLQYVFEVYESLEQ